MKITMLITLISMLGLGIFYTVAKHDEYEI